MATGETGLTPAAAADRAAPTFNTVRRGFDPEQVLTYLKRVVERVQSLEVRLEEAEKQRDEAKRERDIALQAWDEAKQERDPYETMSAHVADLVRSFDEEVEKLRRDAQVEADRILAQAKSEAERTYLEAQGAEAEARGQAEHILREAQEEAERIRRQARMDADQIQADLMAIHGSTLNELRIIRDHMVNSVKELEVVLNGEQPEDRLVVIEGSDEGRPGEEASIPRPDMPSELGQ